MNNKSNYSSFVDLFNELTKQIDKELSDITNMTKFPMYGVCNVDYKLRYITPENISEFIDNIYKCYRSGILENHISDFEMFSVESVKRFLNTNGSCSIDNTTGNMNVFVNPKEMTLDDIIIMIRQRIPQNNVYSKNDMISRINDENFNNDIKTIKDMKFTATMRSIVNNLDKILMEMRLVNDKTISLIIQEFIIFSCVLLLNTIDEIISYINPSSEYNLKNIQESYIDENGNVGDAYYITECCLLKTNNMIIKSKIPFNCNMRDIVLQDTHKNFEDTLRALRFIMKSKRSPISMLVTEYMDKDFKECNSCDKNVMRLIRRASNSNMSSDIEGSKSEDFLDNKAGFTTTLSWLDTITSGNNYLDGNYRRDAVGNNEVHPIGSTLDFIYKTYNICGSCDSKELTYNLIDISMIMNKIIQCYSDGSIPNTDYVRDILATLGECFTRSMLKLYHNNTIVIDASDDMSDTMVPGMMYQEAFVMEADTPPTTGGTNVGGTNPTSTGTNTGNNTGTNTNAGNNANTQSSQTSNVTVTNNNGPSKMQAIKAKITDVIQKFLNWIVNHLGQFASTFNKNHKIEIAYITKNENLHNEIKTNIQSGTFAPQINNFPLYKVPYQKLTNGIKFDETIKKYQSDEKLNIVDSEFEMYPTDIAQNMKSAKTEEEKIGILSNFILYGKPTPGQKYSGKLSVNLWTDMIDNLKGSDKIINDFCKAHSTELKSCAQVLQTTARSANVEASSSDTTKQQTGQKKQSRVEQLFNIVQTVSRVYTITTLNCVQSKFYNVTYKTYSDIIKAYNQQKNQSSFNTQTANPSVPNNQQTPSRNI